MDRDILLITYETLLEGKMQDTFNHNFILEKKLVFVTIFILLYNK